MTRRFWAGLMLVAVLLAGGSAYLLLEKMAEPPPQPVRLKAVPPPKPAQPAVVTASSATAVAASSAAAKPVEKPAEKSVAAASKPAAEETKPEETEKPAPKGKRNILFRYNHAAKDVAILADFNHWKRTPLKKDAKGWMISVPLAPGRYEYAYVVDGKKIRDPNNKQSANNGRVSVLTVKPLAKH